MLQESMLTSKPAKSILDTVAVPAIGKGTIVWDRTMLNHNIIQDVSSSEQVMYYLIVWGRTILNRDIICLYWSQLMSDGYQNYCSFEDWA